MMPKLVQIVGDFLHGFVGSTVTPGLVACVSGGATCETASLRTPVLRGWRDAPEKMKASPRHLPGRLLLGSYHALVRGRRCRLQRSAPLSTSGRCSMAHGVRVPNFNPVASRAMHFQCFGQSVLQQPTIHQRAFHPLADEALALVVLRDFARACNANMFHRASVTTGPYFRCDMPHIFRMSRAHCGRALLDCGSGLAVALGNHGHDGNRRRHFPHAAVVAAEGGRRPRNRGAWQCLNRREVGVCAQRERC